MRQLSFFMKKIDAIKHEILQGNFVVPDYYPHFICKGTACRQSCCDGWDIAISMDQYFKILALPCKKKIREKLDHAFQLVPDPTPERYAMVRSNYQGNCPLHMENGYCLLQDQCGEEALPNICRYYPRGPRTNYTTECSCSNSCERILEQLFEQENKITFVTKELTFVLPKAENKITSKDRAFYQKARTFTFALLSDRSYSLPTRILRIGKTLLKWDKDQNAEIHAEDLMTPAYEKDIPLTYQVILGISEWFIENSRSIADECLAFETYFRSGNLTQKYQEALNHLNAVLPSNEILFEKMILNNLFFRQYPFQDFAESLADEFISLCGIYLLIRYMAISYMRDKDKLEDFIDIMAKTFRVIDHTRFEHNVLVLLQNEIGTDFDTLGKLIQA
jgi:hypothetical protein